MSNLNRDMVFMILQFLKEEKFEGAMHQLECECQFFFNLQYFEEKFLAGAWEECETYLSSFTKPEDNNYSMQLFFEIRKLKYIEALENPDKDKALNILKNELEIFSSINMELFKDLSSLVLLDNIREHQNLSNYTDAESARRQALRGLKKLLEENPILQNKLQFPAMPQSHLQMILNQTPSARPADPPALMMRADNSVDVKPKIEEETMEDVKVITSISENAQQNSASLDELPRAIICTLDGISSDVTTVDFHPFRQTILAAGYRNGTVTIWELRLREILISKPFKIYNPSNCPRVLQDIASNRPTMSVHRLSWSPDGSFLGIAFRRHLVQMYTYRGSANLRIYLEFEAHNGGVNDLVFCYPMGYLAFVTCGDDKLVKIWDMIGELLYSFEGHAAPVYSVCSSQKENHQFLASASVDGQIRLWKFGERQARGELNAPGQWCGRLCYNAEGDRLFSGGTSREGWSFLVEWDESDRSIKRTYTRFQLGGARRIMQYDIGKNKFLAAGEDRQIKFWSLDNVSFLAATFAHGGLPSYPLVRFNKDGNLLAVSTADGAFKILANSDGLRTVTSPLLAASSHGLSDDLVLTQEPGSSSGAANDCPNLNVLEGSSSAGLPRHDPAPNPIRASRRLASRRRRADSWHLEEFVRPSQCIVATLPDSFDTSTKVACLMYNYAGTGILALGSNGLVKLWQWVPNPSNPEGKPTAIVVPELRRPRSGFLMNNDLSGGNTEATVHFMAITRNDDYLMSASGGQVSLFSTKSFKTLQTFQPHSTVVTHLAFHILDNNIMAMGMEDSSIVIYNIRSNQYLCTLEGHHNSITGLTFSIFVGLLVSSGADAQIWLWDIISWGNGERVPLLLPGGVNPASGTTRVEFLHGGALLLVQHESQIAIYDPAKLEWISRWTPSHRLPTHITSASSSARGTQIYAAFNDGNIGVFATDGLRLLSRISPSAYITPSSTRHVYPLVIAAHPDEENQVVVGLSNGSVKVIEPAMSRRTY